MKVLYFDCFSGISGDMALGALLDLGVDQELFRSELDKLNISGYDLIIEKVIKEGLIGTDVRIIINESYEDLHSHSHEGGGDKHAQHHYKRNLKNIEAMLDLSDLKQNVKDSSKKVFAEIAGAEAKVHNVGIDEVHFHEIGAIDSIIDIVGVSICIDLLGIKRVYSSPLHDGQGFVECRHGIMPVPVPAVMEMLSNSSIPLISEDINTELVTPTGMGLIKCLSSGFGNMPAMIIDKIGYGMGKKHTGRFNALRVVMGSLFGDQDMLEEVAVLETNIDDMSPEIMGYTMEKLLQNGALDVFYTPIYMKKNRPAVMLTVLSALETEDSLLEIILKETSTLGIRRNITRRYCMNREINRVNTEYGEVRIKVASIGELKKLSPEYEDCREIADRTGMPLRSVYEMVRENSKHLI